MDEGPPMIPRDWQAVLWELIHVSEAWVNVEQPGRRIALPYADPSCAKSGLQTVSVLVEQHIPAFCLLKFRRVAVDVSIKASREERESQNKDAHQHNANCAEIRDSHCVLQI